ncbi:MAG: hypothetical protein GX318_07260 [Clostridia bacterium]|nr:hypothetical protein [Clostridia bacterium]
MYSNMINDSANLERIIRDTIEREMGRGPQAPRDYQMPPAARQWEVQEGQSNLGPQYPGQIEARLRDIHDPHVRNMVRILLQEPNIAQYVDQMINNPHAKYIPGRNEKGQMGDGGKGILYGVGTVVLFGLLFPSFGQKVQTVFTRTALEGVELVNKARSMMARAREDIEDLIAEASIEGLGKKQQ